MKKKPGERRMPSARAIVGRRIVGFEPNPARDASGRPFHNPIIFLNDGSYLFFVPEETDGGAELGVFIGRTRIRRGRKR